MNRQSVRELTNAQTRLTLLAGLANDLSMMSSAERGYLLSGQEVYLQRYQSISKRFDQRAAALAARPATALQASNLVRLRRAVNDWRTEGAAPEINQRKVSAVAAAALFSTNQGRHKLLLARGVLTEMQHNESGRLLQSTQRSARAFAWLQSLVLLGLFVGMGLICWAIWRSARTVARMVQQVSTGAEQIAGGKYDLRLERSGVRELDNLSEHFNEMAQAVQAREGQLARSNRELERFAYVASHDLQEPLRTIGSYTELLSKRYSGKIDQRADKYIAFTISATQRLKNLIQDLLAFSRVNRSGRTFSEVNVARLVAEVLQELESKVTRTGAQVEVGELPTQQGNAELLHHAFLNLIVNAIKFRSPERPPKVRVWAEKTGQSWTYHVSDNGIGIEPQYHSKIFGVFQRLHGIDEFEGSGIGLALVRSAVEQHSGQIWLESTPGQGSTFSFTLPEHPVPLPHTQSEFFPPEAT